MKFIFLLWLIDFLSNITGLSLVVLLFSGLIGGLIPLFFHGLDCEAVEIISVSRLSRKIFVIFLIVSSILTIVPEKSTMYVMLGAEIAQDAGIPAKITKIINQKLDEYSKELTLKGQQK